MILPTLAMLTLAATLLGPDINNDRIVGGADLGLLIGAWGWEQEPLSDYKHPCDLNGDSKVDGADRGILLGAWGSITRNADTNDKKPRLIPADHDEGPSPFGPDYTRYSWGEWITSYGDRRRAFSIDERKETP